MRALILSLLLLAFPRILAADELYLAGLQAQSYAAVNDLDQAISQYEVLLKRTLTDWQRAVILYNLGSLQLRQHRFEKAADYFQQIRKERISSPWLLKDLEINSGINLLFQSISDFPKSSMDDSLDLLSSLRLSIHHLEAADTLDCFIKRIEKVGAPPSPCEATALIRNPLEEAYQQLRQIKLKLLNNLATSKKQALVLISQGLQQLIQLLQKTKDVKTYGSYLIYQGKTLLPLWNALEDPELQKIKKSYEEELKKLQSNTSEEAIKGLETLQKQIDELAHLTPLDSFLLHSQLLLYKEKLSVEDLHSLLNEYQKMTPNEREKDEQVSAIKYLEKSLEALKNRKSKLAYFYLAATLNKVEKTAGAADFSTPIETLQYGLTSARNAFQLTDLYDQVQADEREKEMAEIVYQAEIKVTQTIQPFITAVLKQQQDLFQQKDTSQSCQKSPWDQVIPLYDQGAKSALEAEKWLKAPQLLAPIFLLQTATIKKWKEALNRLMNPPSADNQSQKPDDNHPQPIKEAPVTPDETLRLLQEMQLEDQPQEWSMPQEFQSW